MADVLTIIVKGKQTHGAQPWKGVDPVVISAQIISALQTITSRQTDITDAPAIVTVVDDQRRPALQHHSRTAS